MELVKLWINDQEVETETRFKTLNPATGEPIAKLCAVGPDEVGTAVDAARAAFPAWSALSPQERCRYLLAARGVLIAAIDKVVALITFTGNIATGKRVAAACAELLCPPTLGLGGIGPFIVMDDVDPEVAAAAARQFD